MLPLLPYYEIQAFTSMIYQAVKVKIDV